jgi:hypothetical protein
MWEPTLPRAGLSHTRATRPRTYDGQIPLCRRLDVRLSRRPCQAPPAARGRIARPSARLRKHPIAGRMVSTLNRYELAGCGSSTFDTTDSRPGLPLLSCVRKPDVRELRRSARSTPQPFKDMFVFRRSAEDMEVARSPAHQADRDPRAAYRERGASNSLASRRLAASDLAAPTR